MRRLSVGKADEGQRLDRVLARLDGGLPASLVRRLLRQRRVRVNDRRTRDASMILADGDRIEIYHDFSELIGAVDDRRTWTQAPLEILHRDDAFLLLNKPPGVACSDDGRDPAALQVWLREMLADPIRTGRVRPEPCHRLDRGTSGVIAVALGPEAFDRFRSALAAARVHKTYEVAVHGAPDSDAFECDQALDRNPRTRRDEARMVPGTTQAAHTRFRVLARATAHTLLEATPLTGRTHQIRAHCRALGLPVVGDPRYGRAPGAASPTGIDHQLLHARRLHLEGPDGFDVQADWPTREFAWLRQAGLRA